MAPTQKTAQDRIMVATTATVVTKRLVITKLPASKCHEEVDLSSSESNTDGERPKKVPRLEATTMSDSNWLCMPCDPRCVSPRDDGRGYHLPVVGGQVPKKKDSTITPESLLESTKKPRDDGRGYPADSFQVPLKKDPTITPESLLVTFFSPIILNCMGIYKAWFQERGLQMQEAYNKLFEYATRQIGMHQAATASRSIVEDYATNVAFKPYRKNLNFIVTSPELTKIREKMTSKMRGLNCYIADPLLCEYFINAMNVIEPDDKLTHTVMKCPVQFSRGHISLGCGGTSRPGFEGQMCSICSVQNLQILDDAMNPMSSLDDM
jgi:hypothetical protein